MARPQVEDGHIKIARELWDAYCRFRIPGEVRQIVDAVIRKTYGWQKKEDTISLDQFVEMTNLKKPHVVRAKKMAIEHKLITQSGNGIISINKDYEQWLSFNKPVTQSGNPEATITKSGNDLPLPKVVTPLPEVVTEITQSGNKSLPKVVPTKDNIKATTKETIQKKGPDSKESAQIKTDSPPPVRKPRAQTATRESQVKEILQEMADYLGYPKDETKRKVLTDPIPNYGKEGNFIKKMLGRKFTKEQILQAWKFKVDIAGGDFISMSFVNEDIGKANFWRRVNGGTQTPKPRIDRTYSHPDF